MKELDGYIRENDEWVGKKAKGTAARKNKHTRTTGLSPSPRGRTTGLRGYI